MLKHFKAYDQLRPKIIRGDHVRTVLAWVAKEDVPYGIVYRSDARVMKNKVKVVFEIPPTSHDPITYPRAVVRKSKEAKFALIVC